MTLDARALVLRAAVGLVPPSKQPLPEFLMVAPRRTTAGVPAAVVLIADAALPELGTPEGLVPPDVSSPAITSGLAPQRRGRRVGVSFGDQWQSRQVPAVRSSLREEQQKLQPSRRQDDVGTSQAQSTLRAT